MFCISACLSTRRDLRLVTCDLRLATCDLRLATCDLRLGRLATCDLRLAPSPHENGPDHSADIPGWAGTAMAELAGMDHQVSIVETAEGRAWALCSCGWRSPIFGADKTGGALDALQRRGRRRRFAQVGGIAPVGEATSQSDCAHEWPPGTNQPSPPNYWSGRLTCVAIRSRARRHVRNCCAQVGRAPP